MAVKNVGENVTVAIEETTATITIDLSHRGQVSSTGKTKRVASTEGNVKITEEVTLGLNAYVKNA